VIPAIPACLWLAETAEFAKKHHIKTMIKNILSTAILAAAGVALSASSAMAQNPNYAPGDIVLFFQQFGGANTVALNVGAATTFRDATANIFNIANIGSQLSNGTTGFGSTWYDLTNLWWGAAGVRSNSTSSTTVTNGDGGRTLYVSRDRNAVGTEGTASSTPWSVGTDGAMTTAANNITSLVNRMETIATTTTLIEGTASSNIDGQNLFNILGHLVRDLHLRWCAGRLRCRFIRLPRRRHRGGRAGSLPHPRGESYEHRRDWGRSCGPVPGHVCH
jgi:hypothetical protein